jgi:hypothetical protein
VFLREIGEIGGSLIIVRRSLCRRRTRLIAAKALEATLRLKFYIIGFAAQSYLCKKELIAV